MGLDQGQPAAHTGAELKASAGSNLYSTALPGEVGIGSQPGAAIIQGPRTYLTSSCLTWVLFEILLLLSQSLLADVLRLLQLGYREPLAPSHTNHILLSLALFFGPFSAQ